MGRRKIDIKEVKDPNTRQVTFSKRRTGLFKKANELSILCGAEVAIVVFSPGNKPYSYGHPSVDVVANRFLRQQNALDDDEEEDEDYDKDDEDDEKDDDNSDDEDDLTDMDKLKKELYDLEEQIQKEENKGKNLSEKLKIFEKTRVPQNNKELQGSYSKFQDKVEDYFDAVEVADYMLLLSEEPVVRGGKQVSKRRKKN